MRPLRVYFATDLHASEICFRKFCEAADFYNCGILIMGGDVTGKMLVPIVANGSEARYELGGEERRVPLARVAEEKKRIANMGYYAVETDEDGLRELDDSETYERRLLDEALARTRAWAEYADARLRDGGTKIYFAPGNDDDFSVDEAFRESEVFVNAEEEVIDVGGYELATTGWSNPTPWKTPRECSEEDLERRIRSLVERVREPERALFNFHVPPHGTALDLCPELDEDFRVVTVMGNPVQAHAGSTAVRTVIEEYQPLASLHGHIHESRNAVKLGRTIAVNPGSEYGEGVLNGAVISLKHGKASYTFTAG